MDIYCPSCGEPWDADMLHEVPDASHATALARFRAEGCALFDTQHCAVPDAENAAQSGALLDLLGDDVDGVASLMSE